MKKILFLSVIFLLVSFANFSCKEKSKLNEKPKTTSELSNQQKAQQILDRANNLMQSLEDTKDIYGLKKVFYLSDVLPCKYDGFGGWSFEFTSGGPFHPIFLLPTQADFDKGCNLPVVMVTKTGIVNGMEIPFVIINPKWLQLAKKDIDIDYIASVALHESIHCSQFVVVELGIRTQSTATDREKEAYLFQFQFIPRILERNGIKGVQVPGGRLLINSHQDMLDAAATVDQLNGGRLGMLSNLVFQQAYLEKCLPFLVLPDSGK